MQKVSDYSMVQGIWAQPNPVMLGRNVAEKTGELVASTGAKKVLLVYDAGLKAVGTGDKIRKNLEAAGLTVIVNDSIKSDPPYDLVQSIIDQAKSDGIEAVVGVGGGSTMDSAKAIGLMVPKQISLLESMQNMNPEPGLPVFVLPTTAGTGSEVSGGAIITTPNGLKSQCMAPVTMALVDPMLMVTAPVSVTAACGMDTLAHAIEAYTNTDFSYRLEVNATAAISKVLEFLPAVCEAPNNIDARENMAFACYMATLAMGEGGVALGHAAAQTLGVLLHLPHGQLCGLALPEHLKIFARYRPERVKKIGELMGLQFSESDDNEKIGEIVADGVRALCRRLGIKSLKECGVKREEIADHPELGQKFMEDLSYMISTVKGTSEESHKMLIDIYDHYQ